MIRALDQAEGISFNARTKKLSYSGGSSHNPGKDATFLRIIGALIKASLHVPTNGADLARFDKENE